MSETGTDWKTAVVLRASEVERLLLWWAVANGEGATLESDNVLAARLEGILESSAPR